MKKKYMLFICAAFLFTNKCMQEFSSLQHCNGTPRTLMPDTNLNVPANISPIWVTNETIFSEVELRSLLEGKEEKSSFIKQEIVEEEYIYSFIKKEPEEYSEEEQYNDSSVKQEIVEENDTMLIVSFANPITQCIKKNKRIQKKLIKDLIKINTDWFTLNSALLVIYNYCNTMYGLLNNDETSTKTELSRVIASLTYKVAYHYYQKDFLDKTQTILKSFMKAKIFMPECTDIYLRIDTLLEICNNAQQVSNFLIKTEDPT